MTDFLYGGGVSIFKYFEIFNYIRYFDIDCTLRVLEFSSQKETNDEIKKIENIFTAYDYFFHHDIKFPKIISGRPIGEDKKLKLNEDWDRWKEWTYQNFWTLEKYKIWPIKKSLPKLQKKYITMSLVESREGLLDNLYRDIHPRYYNILMETFSLNNSVIDLGDSRKFKTSQELIDKINYIRGSQFYIGSQVSWKDIAQIFGTYVLILEPLHHHSLYHKKKMLKQRSPLEPSRIISKKDYEKEE